MRPHDHVCAYVPLEFKTVFSEMPVTDDHRVVKKYETDKYRVTKVFCPHCGDVIDVEEDDLDES